MERIKVWLSACRLLPECNYGKYAHQNQGSHGVSTSESARPSSMHDLAATRTLPTRLIQVSGHHRRPSCRLIETNTLEGAVEYTTLSYRWGQSSHFRCLKRNVNTLRKRIAWRRLPKTLQDAVKVTHMLQIRYIWTDSLCIIQDDEDDWNHEAGTMASVYSGSFLNIAAECSQDSSEGLFRPRHSLEPLLLIDPQTSTEVLCYDDKIYMDTFAETSALENRGWIFQERRLAPRIVRFISNMVTRRCNQRWTDDIQTYSTWYRATVETTDSPSQLWSRVAADYMGTETTYVSDRAIA
ncbi:putative heterokaryon incompatibility [Septoria linicola]|nr:putative heterokaryon incompatibility [Septoria linicola]